MSSYKDMFFISDEQIQRRNELYSMQRPEDPNYGYSIDNPIMMGTIFRSYDYLDRLQTEDGKPLTYDRISSHSINLGGIQGVMVDKYALFLDGEPYKEIYICPYAHNSTFAPKGLRLGDPEPQEKAEIQSIPEDSHKEESADANLKESESSHQAMSDVKDHDPSTLEHDDEKKTDDDNVKVLKELLEAGVLTQSEYDKKIALLSQKEQEANNQKSIDQLKSLYEAGVFTKAEYEAKLSSLMPKKAEIAKPQPAYNERYKAPKIHAKPSASVSNGSLAQQNERLFDDSKEKSDRRIKYLCAGAIIFVVVLLIYAISSNNSWNDYSNTSSSDQEYEDDYTDPYEGLVEKEMPKHETIISNSFGDDRPSEVVIENPTDNAYAMKFVDEDDNIALYFFVRPQTTARMNMGVGTYYLKWAAGTTWYGYDKLFGPETAYQKDTEPYPFDSGNRWTITMQAVTNGNLHSETIDANEF